ncbi:uncharacterized protein LOC142634832 [Castanea sativa]|uniref:uncharacterized protein LOC142634832 n=1 Tax=Castanea sativa TaxID=21020 RepID=UPI003F6542A0
MPGAMSAISWNCWGLGNPCIVRALQKLVLEEDPTFVFLMKTKFVMVEMALMKRKLDRQQGLVVPSSKNQWRFTGFYGHPETNKQMESWRLLEELSSRSSLPWVCMGDFNEIMHEREKDGGNTRPKWQMKNFCAAVNRSNLRDIGYTGSDFTWCRRLGNRGWVRERLDRALVSINWANIFPKETRLELNRMLLVEDDMWQQRSRSCWLKSRDRNTAFFHTKASNRHQGNFITRIKDSNNVCQEEEEIMGRTFVEYFTKLFTSSHAEVSAELLEAVQGKVTDRMNNLLLQEFQAYDVEKSLKQMHPLKALGPEAPPKFHETHIVLISKTKNPERVTDYRPVSLCNVVYKLASKAVANRLKLVLQDIICENQSAYVAKRLITDNVLVAHELMNHINKKKKGRMGEITLKLDMSKAYDRVEWGCL